MSKLNFLKTLVILLLLAGCGGSTKSSKENVYYKGIDDYGREVVIKDEPKRIISVSPGITEILYALDCEATLVGRSEYCVYPEAVKAIPSVGGISDVNVEKIIELKPDVVLIGSMITKQVVDFLTEAGIPTIAIKEKNTFNGVYENILAVGEVLSKTHAAEWLVDTLKTQMKNIIRSTDNTKPKPKIYYVVGYGKSGDYTAGGDTYIQDIITLAGGKNIAEGLQGWSFSRELLFERNPDYIFIRAEDYQSFIETQPYTQLDAVRKGNVYPIESALMDVQTPRSIQAVEIIAEKSRGGL